MLELQPREDIQLSDSLRQRWATMRHWKGRQCWSLPFDFGMPATRLWIVASQITLLPRVILQRHYMLVQVSIWVYGSVIATARKLSHQCRLGPIAGRPMSLVWNSGALAHFPSSPV